MELIEKLKAEKSLALIVLQTLIDEFQHNKTRVIDEYTKSIATTLHRAREIVVQQGDLRRIRRALTFFSDAGYKIRTPKEVAENAAS